MPRFVTLLILFISSNLLHGTGLYQGNDSSIFKIDSYLQSAVDAGKFNGVALIGKDDEVLFHRAYGWRNAEAKSYNDTNTRFPILSITKSFTAIVILKLQEQKKLSLNDKVNKYLPNLKYGDRITIEQLLTHTSGLYNYTDDISEKDSALVNHPIDKQLIIDLINSKPLQYQPGQDFSYNNSGYYIAGLIIEKVSGRSFEQNVRELIFQPLHMNRSGFNFNGLDEQVKAIGYQFLNTDQIKRYTLVDSTVGYAAGGIYSTSGDTFKWARAVADGDLLSEQSWYRAFTPAAGDYGIGFRVNSFLGKNYIRHSGGYPGFVAEFIFYPETGITIILLKNSGTYGEDVWPVAMGLSALLHGLPYDNWKVRTPVRLPDEILRKRSGKYISDDIMIEFIVKEGQLIEVLPNGLELGLLSESADVFYLGNFNTSFTFKKIKGREMLIVHEHGKDFMLRKVY